MKFHRIILFVLIVLLAGCASSQNWGERLQQFTSATGNSARTGEPAGTQEHLPETRVVAGLKAALAEGVAHAVTQLGQKGGFWANPARRIPLPDWVDKTSSILRAAGFGREIEKLHLTINRAAERAIAEVGDIVRQTIQNMSVADAYAILNGGKHAATQYLRRHAAEELAERIRPIVAQATAQSTAARRYQSLVSNVKPLLALASVDINPDLNHYVTQKALDGLFEVIAQQEAQIRADPLARGTELLRAVFGSR